MSAVKTTGKKLRLNRDPSARGILTRGGTPSLMDKYYGRKGF